MGFIVDDHEQGIHGELRRESFSVFSDFGKEWSVELPIDKLDEMIFVLHELRRVRNEGKQYPQHRRFQWIPKENEKDCPVCKYLTDGTGPDHATQCAREKIELTRLDAQHQVVGQMKAWAQTTWPHLRDEIVKMCEDLMTTYERREAVKEWDLSDIQKKHDEILIESYLRAAAEICEGCDRGGEHACRAVPIRAMAARLDPDRIHVSPRDWTPTK